MSTGFPVIRPRRLRRTPALRALVAETPLGDVEARDARRHADALGRHRDTLVTQIAQLEREQDALLDRMSAELSAH